MASNREQILANIHAFDRRCKGPLRLAEEEITLLRSKWEQLHQADDIVAALSFIMAIELCVESGHLPIPPQWDVAFKRFNDLMELHRKEGCGYDFNQIILSHPFDGTDYNVTLDEKGEVIADTRTPCPQCGVKISWKAARLEE